MKQAARPSWWIAGLLGLVVGSVATAGIMHAGRTAQVHAGSDKGGPAPRSGTLPVGGSFAGGRETPEGASPSSGPPGAAPAGGLSATAAGASGPVPVGGPRPSYDQLLATNRTLHAQVAQLERQVAGGGSPVAKTYDIDPAELQQMAASCELRWDIPSLTLNPPTLPDDEVATLALSEAERATINRLFAASHTRLVASVRETYMALTGDDNPGSMSAEAMYAEIGDKLSKRELQLIFQRLASERAGIPMAPATAQPSQAEKMYRTLTTGGDQLEADLAAALNPQLAKALRDLNGGWPSKFSSTHGCPGG